MGVLTCLSVAGSRAADCRSEACLQLADHHRKILESGSTFVAVVQSPFSHLSAAQTLMDRIKHQTAAPLSIVLYLLAWQHPEKAMRWHRVLL